MRRAPYVMLLLAACSPAPHRHDPRPVADAPLVILGMQPTARSRMPDLARADLAGPRDPMPVHAPLTVPYMPVMVPDSSIEYTMRVVPPGGSPVSPAQLRWMLRAPSVRGDSTLWLRVESLRKQERKK